MNESMSHMVIEVEKGGNGIDAVEYHIGCIPHLPTELDCDESHPPRAE